MKRTRMKKHNPMRQLEMARSKECINTAYVPVTNAITIAPMAYMERWKAKASRKEKSPRFWWGNNSGMNRWMKAAEQDSTMAMIFVITKALKAAFLVRTAEPGHGPS